MNRDSIATQIATNHDKLGPGAKLRDLGMFLRTHRLNCQNRCSVRRPGKRTTKTVTTRTRWAQRQHPTEICSDSQPPLRTPASTASGPRVVRVGHGRTGDAVRMKRLQRMEPQRTRRTRRVVTWVFLCEPPHPLWLTRPLPVSDLEELEAMLG